MFYFENESLEDREACSGGHCSINSHKKKVSHGLENLASETTVRYSNIKEKVSSPLRRHFTEVQLFYWMNIPSEAAARLQQY
jgi:hypothetical protein